MDKHEEELASLIKMMAFHTGQKEKVIREWADKDPYEAKIYLRKEIDKLLETTEQQSAAAAPQQHTCQPKPDAQPPPKSFFASVWLRQRIGAHTIFAVFGVFIYLSLIDFQNVKITLLSLMLGLFMAIVVSEIFHYFLVGRKSRN